MPFPIEEKYITETESELNVKFPIEFKNRMIKLNGGELIVEKFDFQLYPFFDKSIKQRCEKITNYQDHSIFSFFDFRTNELHGNTNNHFCGNSES